MVELLKQAFMQTHLNRKGAQPEKDIRTGTPRSQKPIKLQISFKMNIANGDWVMEIGSRKHEW